MRTVKEMLETGSKVEIERMMLVWRGLCAKDGHKTHGFSSCTDLTDLEVLAALQCHSGLWWSVEELCFTSRPHSGRVTDRLESVLRRLVLDEHRQMIRSFSFNVIVDDDAPLDNDFARSYRPWRHPV